MSGKWTWTRESSCKGSWPRHCCGHVAAMRTFNQPFIFASLAQNSDSWEHLIGWALIVCWHCLPRGGSFWETSKRMLKEVGGRYTSKPGRGQVGCYTAIKEKKKRQRRQRTIMGEKMGEKNLMVSPIYFQHCFLKISVSILNTVLNFYSPSFCSLS